MIHAQNLTKRYGDRVALDHVSFDVKPGMVTGFLGPNGAGKSTTMRLIVGLDRASEGDVTVNGKHYSEHRAPLREVGVLLDAKAVHRGRSAFDHLLAMGATHGIGKKRVDEVIALTGLESVAKKRVGGFSLGMGQRLGIAAALLGDPATLILDEPVNGLDPEGVVWVRNLAKHLAREGRTVFLSSHLMSEMAQTADHIIVLGRGRVIADESVDKVLARAKGDGVRVRTPQVAELTPLLNTAGVTVTGTAADLLEVHGLPSSRIGEIAASQGLVLHELTPLAGSLEDAYMALTADEVEYRDTAAAPSTATKNSEVVR
ncbi:MULTISPECIES: ABC transporter ATP-binding protein [unclassified Frondihabitans]|uniref:ABC transporter ATP-binding protein n=1 Tax=unclassified Frondihabitans TaxID=2626248 RepID=UPI0006FA25A9|nr:MULTISPECIES: ATP-binding cassette domain-containing protein [unclassified Frondihabitans]KQQ28251.1 multidrug ABC transporter ATP-binding protein [Frondihabitans sp. Leaf304]MBF4576117.1 ATP-binding cassette domain-containing protein [Frondihabitans sp. VKM Ac-2883]